MSKLKELIAILNTNHRVFIQMHNSPDPDAIASAYGLSYLLELEGISNTICYKGMIDKFNTQKMLELLEIKVAHIDGISDMSNEDQIILVDSQKGNANSIDLVGNEVAAIDHHPIYHKIDYLFEDIRPNIGACATLIANYFIEGNIPIPKLIATALLYGIKMDTAELSRGVSFVDLDTFCYLYKISDITLINKIEINTLQFEELKAYGNAIHNIKIFKNVGFANIGFDCPDSLLGTISDFVLSIKEVDFCVVYSPKNEGVKFSVRNETEHLDAGLIISKALENYGSGGGHKTMAGGFVKNEAILSLGGHWQTFFQDRILELIFGQV